MHIFTILLNIYLLFIFPLIFLCVMAYSLRLYQTLKLFTFIFRNLWLLIHIFSLIYQTFTYFCYFFITSNFSFYEISVKYTYRIASRAYLPAFILIFVILLAFIYFLNRVDVNVIFSIPKAAELIYTFII